MDNNELKIKSIAVQQKIDAGRAKGENVEPYLKEKMELLKIGYEKLSEQLKDEKYEKNPRKYSTLLSYVNTMKNIADEIKLPKDEINAMEEDVKAQMAKNNLAWLLNK